MAVRRNVLVPRSWSLCVKEGRILKISTKNFTSPYWDEFYRNRKGVDFPTPFAEFCLKKYIHHKSKVLELGCGNGRDAFYFAQNGVSIVGLDQSEVAILANNARVENSGLMELLRFKAADFTELEKHCLVGTDVIYSRFAIHAITEETENKVLLKAYELLPAKGLFLIEVRTVNDDLFGKGRQISSQEYVTDHYRRFIDTTLFLKKCLSIGWKVRYLIEDRGLAVYKGEDPIVARFVLAKS